MNRDHRTDVDQTRQEQHEYLKAKRAASPAQGELDAEAVEKAAAAASATLGGLGWSNMPEQASPTYHWFISKAPWRKAVAAGIHAYLAALPPPAPAGVEIIKLARELAQGKPKGVTDELWVQSSTRAAQRIIAAYDIARFHPAPQLAAVEAERDWLREVLECVFAGHLSPSDALTALTSGPTGDAGGEQRHD